LRVQKNQFFFGLGLTRAGSAVPDLAVLDLVAKAMGVQPFELVKFV
jgi:hypothetical protein